MKESDRRSFLRKIFTLTASAGVAGLLLDRIPGKSVIQPVQATGGNSSGGSLIIDANSSTNTPANTGTGTTELDTPGNPGFLVVNTATDGAAGGAALQGSCSAGTGVMGTTTTGTGVQGVASSSSGTALFGFASVSGAIPLLAQGPGGKMQVNGSGAMLATQVGQSSPNVTFVNPQNPPSFTNQVATSYLADGLALHFTPKLSGNVLVLVAVDLYNSSGSYTFANLMYGTGTAPSFGATLPAGGVQIGGRGNINASGSLFAFITGLTIGTQYWFDLGHGINGGSGTHANITYTIVEI